MRSSPNPVRAGHAWYVRTATSAAATARTKTPDDRHSPENARSPHDDGTDLAAAGSDMASRCGGRVHHKGTKINTKGHEENKISFRPFVCLCATLVPLW